MVKANRLVIAAAAAGMIFSLSACKKGNDTPAASNSTPAVEAPAPAVVEQPLVANWDKAVVNGLLPFVPADTPIIYASTRQIDFNHPLAVNVLSKTSNAFDDMVKFLNDGAAAPDMDQKNAEDLRQISAGLTSLKDLFKDFKKAAPEYGLNPDHMDEIYYLDNLDFVIKFSVDDGAKVKQKLGTFVNKIFVKSDTSTEVKSGEDVWEVYTEAAPEPAPTTGGEAAPAPAPQPTSSIAINYGKNVVTIVYLFENASPEKLARFTKPAGSSISKDALGPIEDNVSTVGFIDTVRAVDKLLAGSGRKLIEKQFEEEIPAACDPELKALAEDYPRIQVVNRVLDANTMVSDTTLLFKDKASLKKIQDLHTAAMDLKTASSLVGIKINMDFAKALSSIIEIAGGEHKTYQCEFLSDISDAFYKELPSMIADPEFVQVKDYLNALSGVNIIVDKIDMQNMAFDAVVNVAGPKLNEVVPQVLPMAAESIPALKDLKANAEAPTVINLKPLIEQPVMLSAYMTDTDLMVGTEKYDVKALAASPKTNDKSFIELYMASQFISDLIKALTQSAPDTNPIIQDFENINQKLPMRMTLSIGTNDEGLAGHAKLVF